MVAVEHQLAHVHCITEPQSAKSDASAARRVCQIPTKRPNGRGMGARDNPVHRVRGGWPGLEIDQTGGVPL